jgi:hypothetical protein
MITMIIFGWSLQAGGMWSVAPEFAYKGSIHSGFRI